LTSKVKLGVVPVIAHVIRCAEDRTRKAAGGLMAPALGTAAAPADGLRTLEE
jgi:hypothetical protein